MDLKDKVIIALQKPLNADYIRLEDDDGISGFVVSKQFEEMSTLDRQQLIDKALRKADDQLSKEEQRQILMIAGLTPLEYESVGARIRVHKIEEQGKSSIEVMLHGGYSDAEYVRGVMNNQKDVKTTDPKQILRAEIFMKFRASGTDANPLTKEKAIRVLSADPYIEVMQNA